MTDKFDDNLISGYLDDQLTPSQRAEMESRLRDPETKQSLSELAHQSEDLKKLPKFKLDSSFADRVLSDDRAESAFAAMERGTVDLAPLGADTAASKGRLGAAVTAIAALAAMVLVALFLPQAEMAKVQVASAAVEQGEKAVEETLETVADSEIETQVDFYGQDEELPTDSVALGVKDESESMKKESDRGLELADKVAEEEPSVMSAAARGSALPRSRSRAKSSADGIVLKQPQQPAKPEADGPKGAARKQEQNEFGLGHKFEPSTPMMTQGGRGGGGRMEIPPARSEPGFENGFREVIEVRYAGSDKFTDFQNALRQNAIPLTNANRGRRNRVTRGGGAAGDEIAGVPPVNARFQTESEMLVEVTATPRQIASFVNGLKSNASVYRIQPGRGPAVAGAALGQAAESDGETTKVQDTDPFAGRAVVLSRDQVADLVLEQAFGAKVKEGTAQRGFQNSVTNERAEDHPAARYLFILRANAQGPDAPADRDR